MDNQKAILEMKISEDVIKEIISYNTKYDPQIDNTRNKERLGALKLAISALERQIPKRIIYVPGGVWGRDWICPSCKNPCNPYSGYCQYCGQAVEVNWRGDNE